MRNMSCHDAAHVDMRCAHCSALSYMLRCVVGLHVRMLVCVRLMLIASNPTDTSVPDRHDLADHERCEGDRSDTSTRVLQTTRHRRGDQTEDTGMETSNAHDTSDGAQLRAEMKIMHGASCVMRDA